ncbi:PaaX family transcriptional regulator [Phytohabitans aurantiacus]|uniref:PaaX family transcriptional regulator n=1 Tax=Phytohabitans aurantiacus TaxID=3016789 RepID=A0ABQ5QQ21_9ACTN|nr:PaaX family transcriptional regulator C-terminal domain-containing protein [Phytohabitans aurantiacus]GLH96474.1 PaaX family transcriptional regulator [Phytohabitans aurantiacus]
MESPFNVEEIFPDVAAGSGRLPRRQTGGSPQSLAVTLVADYTLRTRAYLPTAAIVDLLGEFGVSNGAARTTISRLARRGVLEGGREGRHSRYCLTKDAAADLSIGGVSIAAFAAHPDTWDRLWTVIVFTLPKENSTERSALRAQLRWRGFAPLYDGVWVSPQPLTAQAYERLSTVSSGAMTSFRAQHLQFAADGERAPIEAWDIDAIAEQYRGFIQRWKPLLPRVRAGRVTGAAAVRARTEVMESYRRFPALDPGLPLELTPRNWPRSRARQLFVTVYDGLVEPAQEHVRATVARAENEPRPDIRAHTIAEMGAGVGTLA